MQTKVRGLFSGYKNMKSEIILKNVCLDFPVYDAESLSFRNKMSDMGKVIVTKTTKNNSGGKIIEGLRDINYIFISCGVLLKTKTNI